MSDENILNNLEQQNQDAISMILDEYGGLISYIIRNTVILNQEEIEECISDVVFAVWKKRDKYDESKSSFKSWLVLITRGCAIDYYRKVQKHQKMISYEAISSIAVYNETFESLSLNSIIDLLQQLPPPDNEIFYDKFIMGKDIEEISNRCKLSKENI